MACDWSRGFELSSSNRSDTTEIHGPLQRLLGARRFVINKQACSEDENF